MRLSSQEIKDILGTDYIDEELKDLTYDHANHLVQMSYQRENGTVCIISFGGCLTVTYNKWHTGVISYYFHEIIIEDIEIEGKHFYKCDLLIPMMDCKIICQTIRVN